MSDATVLCVMGVNVKAAESASQRQHSHDKCPNCGWELSPPSATDSTSEINSTPIQSNGEPLLVPVADQIEYYNAGSPQRRGKDERRYKRLETRCKAAIRIGDVEDVVEVKDISRRGLRFYSSKLYQPGTLVKVSAPYTIGGNNIFSSGRILRAHRRPTELVAGDYALEILP